MYSNMFRHRSLSKLATLGQLLASRTRSLVSLVMVMVYITVNRVPIFSGINYCVTEHNKTGAKESKKITTTSLDYEYELDAF